MHIRDAKLEDIETLLGLFRRMHGESSTYSKYPLNLNKARFIVEKVLSEPAPSVFFKVLAEDDELAGAMFGEVVEDLWTDAKYASEHGLYVKPEARRRGGAALLVSEFDSWAEGQGAQKIDIRVNAGIDDDGGAALFEAMGYERRGIYMGKDF